MPLSIPIPVTPKERTILFLQFFNHRGRMALDTNLLDAPARHRLDGKSHVVKDYLVADGRHFA